MAYASNNDKMLEAVLTDLDLMKFGNIVHQKSHLFIRRFLQTIRLLVQLLKLFNVRLKEQQRRKFIRK